MYPSDKKGRSRKVKVTKHLEHLAGASDILCLQETQLLELDCESLGHSLKSHIVFYNNAREGRRGGSRPLSLGPSPLGST